MKKTVKISIIAMVTVFVLVAGSLFMFNEKGEEEEAMYLSSGINYEIVKLTTESIDTAINTSTIDNMKVLKEQ